MPAAGVPLSVPVPSPLSVNVTPPGSATPVRVIPGVGNPVVVTVKDAGDADRERRRWLALVMAGGWLTVSVKACGAVAPTVFVAVKVIA